MKFDPGATERERLLALLGVSHGVITREQVDAEHLDKNLLTQLVREGVLERVQPGTYRALGAELLEHEDLVLVQLRVPRMVVCLLSALDFHGLGTHKAVEVQAALPRGTRRPEMASPPTRFFSFSGARYEYGIETHQIGVFSLRVYSPEKTLADLLRYRAVFGTDAFLEGLHAYVRRKNQELPRLLEAARLWRQETLMRTYLEAVQ